MFLCLLFVCLYAFCIHEYLLYYYHCSSDSWNKPKWNRALESLVEVVQTKSLCFQLWSKCIYQNRVEEKSAKRLVLMWVWQQIFCESDIRMQFMNIFPFTIGAPATLDEVQNWKSCNEVKTILMFSLLINNVQFVWMQYDTLFFIQNFSAFNLHVCLSHFPYRLWFLIFFRPIEWHFYWEYPRLFEMWKSHTVGMRNTKLLCAVPLENFHHKLSLGNQTNYINMLHVA